ncbi:MAG TPA: phosphatase PAP2 family protein [Bacteriovoracaceae bacterium]|nr:phosphatase PAP2 family protein [Bacteriovoracaceae bacterium]
MTFLIGILFFCVSSLAGEEGYLQPVLRDWSSPVSQAPGRQVLGVGSALTLTFFFIKRAHGDHVQLQANRDKPLADTSGTGAVIGYAVPNLLYTGWWYVQNQRTANRFYKKRALLMVKATGYAALTTSVLKYTIRQYRPAGGENDSFPSGHATSAFAFASVIGAVHGWTWGVPSYLLASFIAYGRLNDNRHFTHDVLAGATIGTAYGLSLYKLQEEKSESDSVFMLHPMIESKGLGFSFARSFH